VIVDQFIDRTFAREKSFFGEGVVAHLGALIGPLPLLDGEYWRVVTAGLHHYGFVHLALNLVGIWIFGRLLERMIGPWRFLLCYVASGIGAMSLIVLWSAVDPGERFFLVGASASLMGVVGASAAVLLKRWRKTRSPRVARQLAMIGLIVALQTVFDLVTPQVSFAAHFGGALLGLALGALAGVERPPTPKTVPPSPTRSSA
jgi:rhomboid protease GluP